MDIEPIDCLVIGGGPAGLMAAEVLSAAGRKVVVADAMPSLGRKFLMAGKSGLNLTMDAPAKEFAVQFTPPDWLGPIVAEFDPDAVQDWARGLGQEVFRGSTGRVFPVAMKASPLLRAWLARLTAQGVTFRTRWRWVGMEAGRFDFETAAGPTSLAPRRTILALGGASWPRLGSTGHWAEILRAQGVDIKPFQASNMGFLRSWSPFMAQHFGKPVKHVRLSAGALEGRGEFAISAKGVEGGGIYALSAALRDGAKLSVDLMPDMDLAAVRAKLETRRKGDSLSNHLRKALRLDAAKIALLNECARPLPEALPALAQLLKVMPLALDGAYPITQAISTVGGIARSAVSDRLELNALPGVYVAGEMLDWDAPTGGYLLTGCLATGRWAAQAALRE